MKRRQLLIAALLFSLLMVTALLTVGYSAIATEMKAENPPSSAVLAKTPPRVNRAIKRALPNTPIHSIRPSGIPGLFEIVAGKNLFYIDSSGRHLVFGEIYDLESATNITAERFGSMKQVPTISWGDLPMDAAVHYGRSVDGLKLAVFSDPDCPYCRKLTRALQQVDDIEVSEIMFPVTALHSEARSKAAAILCADDPASALGAAVSGRAVDTPDSDACVQEASKKVDRAVAFGRKHGINGTPTLIAPDGRVHSGFMPPEKIKSWLKEEQP